jgi:methylthioribulose-1-phosphate dehydratase
MINADSPALQSAATSLSETGAYLHSRGWCLGTSSNFSIVLQNDPLLVLLTASGKDKGRLAPGDFVLLDAAGNVRAGAPNRPSAEMWLHLVLARRPGVGAVLHTHSVWGTLLSDLFGDAGGFPIDGYEMLKGLDGIASHEARKFVEIFPNTQDIPALARTVAARLDDAERPLAHGYLIRNHGLYTWGRDLDEARRHVEVFEFLFEVLGRRRSLA